MADLAIDVVPIFEHKENRPDRRDAAIRRRIGAQHTWARRDVKVARDPAPPAIDNRPSFV
jgi:hypothetical protein